MIAYFFHFLFFLRLSGPASSKERLQITKLLCVFLCKNSSALKIRYFGLWNSFFHFLLPSHPLPISDAVSGFMLLSVSLNGEKDWCLFSQKATGPLCMVGRHSQMGRMKLSVLSCWCRMPKYAKTMFRGFTVSVTPCYSHLLCFF